MSRIGRAPITIPAGVTVDIAKGNIITVKGPKGTLTRQLRPEMIVSVEGAEIHVQRPSDDKLHRSLHGLTRTLISNMVVGVTTGFQKQLEINGVGYKAAVEGKKLVLNIGYSHSVIFEQPEGISFEVPNPNTVIVHGIDKQQVGQLSAEIRGKRPPEPYLGKGIKYSYEKIRRKVGKAAK